MEGGYLRSRNLHGQTTLLGESGSPPRGAVQVLLHSIRTITQACSPVPDAETRGRGDLLKVVTSTAETEA